MAFNNRNLVPLLCFLTFVATIQKSYAGIAEFDDYLKKKDEFALESSFKAYDPHPEAVTDQFNKQVGEVLTSGNVTRRHLKEGECMATNPIDRCWRCDPNWAKNRKKLADCARGFGHQTHGGKDGRYYIVTDPSDDNVELADQVGRARTLASWSLSSIKKTRNEVSKKLVEDLSWRNEAIGRQNYVCSVLSENHSILDAGIRVVPHFNLRKKESLSLKSHPTANSQRGVPRTAKES
ncbi:pectate lyase-like [Olea europaea var. sylvestris]|uniref:pectate lyase-like n=1 Tax=Olea europaea var. sylvestris TaxID=158386 RepID=UPI000C1D749C|nr:pectate lyase-like [Olea europaea var. sylvestris]